MAERGIIFKEDYVNQPDKSWFDNSRMHLTTMNFGEIVPALVEETFAEHTIHSKSSTFARLMPLTAPTYGKANLFKYRFYVRNRSIWKSWEEFMADHDQRESWQQPNTSWTPPELPYLKVHKTIGLLTDSLWRGAIPMLDGITGVEYSNSFVTDLNNVYVFTLWYQSDGIHCTLTLYGVNTPSPMNFDQTNELVQFYVIPNKHNASYFDDRSNDLGYAPIYNPFSPSSLLHYMGIELSGFYQKQRQFYKSAIDDFRTALNDSSTHDLIENETYIPDDHIGAVSRGSNQYAGYYDPWTFFENNYIIGMTYSHNHQQCHITPSGAITFSGQDTTHKATVEAMTNPGIIGADYRFSTLPLRAYHSIYIDYFRDENYMPVNPWVDFVRSGEDIDMTCTQLQFFQYLSLQYKCYEHDPYTSALPDAQRGQAIRFIPDASLKESNTRVQPTGTSFKNIRLDADGSYTVTGGVTTSANTVTNITVDLSAATIENFRFANALQKLSETLARSGNRYYEYMGAVYGAWIDDAKIDRAIYLGGDKSPIQISEVVQTSASQIQDDQPLGQLAGRGISINNDEYLEYICPDGGFYFELVCALPRTNYAQGIAPMFTRRVKLDYPMPQFAQLGEEQVPISELWFTGNEDDDNQPFGYQSRYYQWKYRRDITSGAFCDSLKYWTWTRFFATKPIAGKQFLEVHPDYRQFAVVDKTQDHIMCIFDADCQVMSPLPVFGTPKL